MDEKTVKGPPVFTWVIEWMPRIRAYFLQSSVRYKYLDKLKIPDVFFKILPLFNNKRENSEPCSVHGTDTKVSTMKSQK